MSRVLVIVGSPRPKRASDAVVPWVLSRAGAYDGLDVELSFPAA
jgi:NAD(P)H-dependent FMN reductase